MNARKKDAKKNIYIGIQGKVRPPFKYHLADHRDYVLNEKQNQATKTQFYLPGHSLGDLSGTMIERG